MITILEKLQIYFCHLDWDYILTFIMITYACNNYKLNELIAGLIRINIRTRYRVLFIGIVYGILRLYIRGGGIEQIECLFESFLFAVVFHKFLIDSVIKMVFSTAQKFFSDENEKSLNQ